MQKKPQIQLGIEEFTPENINPNSESLGDDCSCNRVYVLCVAPALSPSKLN
ncbi:hypothetical protein [Vibrio jasicida]|uniref:Uncharacterized protein n=1 Tax=Vibrio jasicida TaxID=766224 RepID=A0ABW7J7I0_9VIBR